MRQIKKARRKDVLEYLYGFGFDKDQADKYLLYPESYKNVVDILEKDQKKTVKLINAIEEHARRGSYKKYFCWHCNSNYQVYANEYDGICSNCGKKWNDE